MQKKETGLRGDRAADFVSECKTAAAFKMFLLQDYLNMPEKLGLIRNRESPKNWNITFHDVGKAGRAGARGADA